MSYKLEVQLDFKVTVNTGDRTISDKQLSHVGEAITEQVLRLSEGELNRHAHHSNYYYKYKIDCQRHKELKHHVDVIVSSRLTFDTIFSYGPDILLDAVLEAMREVQEYPFVEYNTRARLEIVDYQLEDWEDLTDYSEKERNKFTFDEYAARYEKFVMMLDVEDYDDFDRRLSQEELKLVSKSKDFDKIISRVRRHLGNARFANNMQVEGPNFDYEIEVADDNQLMIRFTIGPVAFVTVNSLCIYCNFDDDLLEVSVNVSDDEGEKEYMVHFDHCYVVGLENFDFPNR